jgi:hypothetical protein
MGGQIGTWADAGIVGTADAAVGRGLATLIRRLAVGTAPGARRPAGLIAGCICVCAGELPQAGVRSGLVPATGAMTGARPDRRLPAGAALAWAAADSGPGGRRVCAGQPADSGYAGAPLPERAAAGEGRCRAGAVEGGWCRPGSGARMTGLADEPGSVPSAAQTPGAGAADAAGGLGFPDAPRLELDQLLVQLVDRADDVLATQGRLRGLLRANALVAGELSLPLVLRQIVGAARDLLGARYAALGVLGRGGGLEQFVHAGMDGQLVARIGDLPQGRRIFGLLISEPVPIRLADLSAHPASAGFPPGHPPMTGFLGVPVRIGEEVFGNLYLTERSGGGDFTAEDEKLAIALAAACWVPNSACPCDLGRSAGRGRAA